MAILTRGVPALLMLILLLSSVLIVEGGAIQQLQDNQRRRLQLNHDNIVENHVATNDQLNPKFFQNMVNTNHELTAVESHQKTSEFQPATNGYSSHSVSTGELTQQNDFTSVSEEPTLSSSATEKKNLLDGQGRTGLVPEDPTKKNLLDGQGRTGLVPEDPTKKILLVLVPNWKRPGKSPLHHHRQKRFITSSKLRVIAVPLSVFNFLGFLPVRVPGLPYHKELPPPDYTYYNTMHDVYSQRRYKYF